MTEPTTPARRANQMSKVWTGSGQPFPIDVSQLALEITKHRADPIAKVVPHDIEGIDGISKSSNTFRYTASSMNLRSGFRASSAKAAGPLGHDRGPSRAATVVERAHMV